MLMQKNDIVCPESAESCDDKIPKRCSKEGIATDDKISSRPGRQCLSSNFPYGIAEQENVTEQRTNLKMMPKESNSVASPLLEDKLNRQRKLCTHNHRTSMAKMKCEAKAWYKIQKMRR